MVHCRIRHIQRPGKSRQAHSKKGWGANCLRFARAEITGADMKCCIGCIHYIDAHYSRTYVTPQCTQRGADSAAFMREFVCGVDEAQLFEPMKIIEVVQND